MEPTDQMPQWTSRHARGFRPPPSTRSSASSSTAAHRQDAREPAPKKARSTAEVEKDKDQNKGKDKGKDTGKDITDKASRWDFPRVPLKGPQKIGKVVPALREPAVRQQAMAELERDM